jgi:hypothetical protein
MGTLQFSKWEMIGHEYLRNMDPPETYVVIRFSIPFLGEWDAERVKRAATNKCEQAWGENFKRMQITNVHSPITFDGNDSRQRNGSFEMTVVLLENKEDMRTQYGLSADI